MFKGLHFGSTSALLVSALLLDLANAVVKPLLVFLTLPLTLQSFGLFLLVVNALVLLLVAKLVDGFRLNGFWTAFWASIFIALLVGCSGRSCLAVHLTSPSRPRLRQVEPGCE